VSRAERQRVTTDDTDIQEYLLLKGVEAVAIHGSKSEFAPPHFVCPC
jgi:hypothetical protein